MALKTASTGRHRPLAGVDGRLRDAQHTITPLDHDDVRAGGRSVAQFSNGLNHVDPRHAPTLSMRTGVIVETAVLLTVITL